MRRRGLLVTVLLGLLLLAWSGALDRVAHQQAEAALARVVVAFGISRTLNGVISVAQGTEIALQPAGVGVTLTAGEVLDPLNDLVERFSLLALAASVSLGTQMVVGELLGELWSNLIATVAVAFFLITLAVRPLHGLQTFAARTASLVLFVRLAMAIVMFSANWLGNLSLGERHATAIAELTQTQEAIATISETVPQPTPEPEAGLLDRVTGFFAEKGAALDLRARLDAVTRQAEAAVSHLVMLSVVFLLQYLILPIGAGWLVLGAIRSAWHLWLGGRDLGR